jgi:hypothetical protein
MTESSARTQRTCGRRVLAHGHRRAQAAIRPAQRAEAALPASMSTRSGIWPGIGWMRRSGSGQAAGSSSAGRGCRGGAGARSPRRSALLHHLAGIHHHHPGAVFRDHAQIVGDHRHAMPSSVRSVSISSSTWARMVTSSAVVGSSAISRLRPAGERDGDHDALAHAAGELVRIVAKPRPGARGCRRGAAAPPPGRGSRGGAWRAGRHGAQRLGDLLPMVSAGFSAVSASCMVSAMSRPRSRRISPRAARRGRGPRRGSCRPRRGRGGRIRPRPKEGDALARAALADHAEASPGEHVEIDAVDRAQRGRAASGRRCAGRGPTGSDRRSCCLIASLGSKASRRPWLARLIASTSARMARPGRSRPTRHHQEVAPVRHHRAPGGGRRLHAEAEEGERSPPG